MKTFPLVVEPGGRVLAFEIDNAGFGPSALARVLRRTDGVTNVRLRRRLWGDRDIHVRFTYQGYPCMVWEPYGDNSRYWIGPDSTADFKGNVAQLEKTFSDYRLPMHRAILGTFLRWSFLLALLFAVGCWLRYEWRIDSCLDRGGRWDVDLDRCEAATE